MAAVFYKARFAPVDHMSVHCTEAFREALINPAGIYQRARGVARTHLASKSVTCVIAGLSILARRLRVSRGNSD